MHRLAGLVLVLLAFVGPVSAQEPARDVAAADRAAIRTVIEAQLAAFRRDDGAAAFGFASPTIQSIFQTPEIFMQMVKGGYRAVYRPQTVEFRDLVRVEGELHQLVWILGPDGVPVIAAYAMQRQGDGRWLINGCQLLTPPDQSA